MLKKITRWLERETVYTQVANDSSIKLLPEFVFKEKGNVLRWMRPKTCIINGHLKDPTVSSRCLKPSPTLQTVSTCLCQKNYAIYVLDDYSVHLLHEVKEALLKHGYVYVGIGGGITGDIQVNIILKFLLDPLFPLLERARVLWYD